MSLRERGRYEWRAPSDEQLRLEAKLAGLIKRFIQSGNVTASDLRFTVTLAHFLKAEGEIAVILQQAHEMGVLIGQGMLDGTQESAVGDVARSWAAKARSIVQGIVDRVRELISTVLDGALDDADSEQLAQEAVASALDHLPDLLAETEIPTAVEDGVMAALQQGEVARVVWVVSPGACALCLANAERGSVALGEVFPSGQTQAPAHPRCRCGVAPAGSE